MLGLTRAWVVPRAAVEAALRTLPADAPRPERWHPGYRQALVLGSSGPAFWRAFRATQAAPPDPAADPLDRYTEAVVETLRTALLEADPAAVSVYPFRHARQLLGFQRLLGGAGWLGPAPIGVWVEPRAGPWWALRGALLTALDWPATPMAAASPCSGCPAPCVTACPAGAVHTAGFTWQTCADYRLAAMPCRETCLARLACPVGPESRYDADAIAHHSRASLRELQHTAR